MVILFLERKKCFINVKIVFPYKNIYHGEGLTRKTGHTGEGTGIKLRTGLYDTRMTCKLYFSLETKFQQTKPISRQTANECG